MDTGVIKIILFSARQWLAEEIASQLLGSEVRPVAYDCDPSLLGSVSFDLILLDLAGAPISLIEKLYRQSPRLPLIVLADLENEVTWLRAAREGVDTILIAKELKSGRLKQAVHFAVARARIFTEFSARPIAGQALSRWNEKAFARLVKEYSRFLDEALDRQTFKPSTGEREIPNHVEALARELGDLHAGPKDLVELHTCALKEKYDDENPAKYLAFANEGRLLLLELMGYLLGYYRNLTLTSRQESANG